MKKGQKGKAVKGKEKNIFNKNKNKDKEEIEILKNQFNKLQEDSRKKELNNKALIDKYKNQIEIANNKIIELNGILNKLKPNKPEYNNDKNNKNRNKTKNNNNNKNNKDKKITYNNNNIEEPNLNFNYNKIKTSDNNARADINNNGGLNNNNNINNNLEEGEDEEETYDLIYIFKQVKGYFKDYYIQIII